MMRTFIVIIVFAGAITFGLHTYLGKDETNQQLGDIEMLYRCFKGKEEAILNGIEVLSAIKGKKSSAKMIGKYAAFYGGTAPPGKNANLILSDGTILDIKVLPYRDVRPQAVVWSVCVLGRLDRIDFEKRIIYMTVKPANWRVVGAQ